MLKKVAFKNYEDPGKKQFCFNGFEHVTIDLFPIKELHHRSQLASILFLLQAGIQQNLQVSDIFSIDSFANGTTRINLEILAEIEGIKYWYRVAIDRFRPCRKLLRVHEISVVKEQLACNGRIYLNREGAQTRYLETEKQGKRCEVDTLYFALPNVGVKKDNPLSIFREWFENIWVFRPFTLLMLRECHKNLKFPELHCGSLANEIHKAISRDPSLYERMATFLSTYLLNFKKFTFDVVDKELFELNVLFHDEKQDHIYIISFDKLTKECQLLFLHAFILFVEPYQKDQVYVWDNFFDELPVKDSLSIWQQYVLTFKKDRQLIAFITESNLAKVGVKKCKDGSGYEKCARNS